MRSSWIATYQIWSMPMWKSIKVPKKHTKPIAQNTKISTASKTGTGVGGDAHAPRRRHRRPSGTQEQRSAQRRVSAERSADGPGMPSLFPMWVTDGSRSPMFQRTSKIITTDCMVEAT